MPGTDERYSYLDYPKGSVGFKPFPTYGAKFDADGRRKARQVDPAMERKMLAEQAITPMQASVSTQDDQPLAGVTKGAIAGGVAGALASPDQTAANRARYIHLNEQFNLGTAANLRSRHMGKGDTVLDLDSVRAERDAIGRAIGSRANAADLAARSQITDEQRALKYREMQGIMTSNLDRERKLGYEQAGDADKRAASNFMATTPNEYSVAPDRTNYPERIAAQTDRQKFWGDESIKVRGERDTAIADRKRVTDLTKQIGFTGLENEQKRLAAEGRAIDNPVLSTKQKLEEYNVNKMFNDTVKADKLGKLGIRTSDDLSRVSNDIMTAVETAADGSPFNSGEDAMAVLNNEQLPLFDELASLEPEFAKTLARQIRTKLAMSKNGFWNGVGKLADSITPDWIRDNTPSWVNYATSLGLPIPTPGGIIEAAKLHHEKMKRIDTILKRFERS